MLQKHLILFQDHFALDSTIIHASFNFSPIGPLSSFQAIAMALGPFLCMHRMVHCSSPQTEGIQSSREACPWHGAHLNSTLACKTYRLSLLKPLHNVRLSLQKISRYPPKGRKKMVELHVCKVKRIFITYFQTSKVDIK